MSEKVKGEILLTVDKVVELITEVADGRDETFVENIIDYINSYADRLVGEPERTICSTSDKCEKPKKRYNKCQCVSEGDEEVLPNPRCPWCDGRGDWENVNVMLIDGPCDSQEHIIKYHKPYFNATSGEFRFDSETKYVWVTRNTMGYLKVTQFDNLGRAYLNDLSNPGQGIYVMKPEEDMD